MLKQKEIVTLVAGGILFLIARNARAGASSAGGNGDLIYLSYLGNSWMPRGLRNNNPGNLKISNSQWQGKIPLSQNTDGTFEQFETYVWGIRAMTKLLRNHYMQTLGLRTIADIIPTYAPASDNNNENAYINHVAQLTGFSPTGWLDRDYNTMQKLVIAMAAHENGVADAISPQLFNVAWSLL